MSHNVSYRICDSHHITEHRKLRTILKPATTTHLQHMCASSLSFGHAAVHVFLTIPMTAAVSVFCKVQLFSLFSFFSSFIFNERIGSWERNSSQDDCLHYITEHTLETPKQALNPSKIKWKMDQNHKQNQSIEIEVEREKSTQLQKPMQLLMCKSTWATNCANKRKITSKYADKNRHREGVHC